VIGKPRTWVMAHPEVKLTDQQHNDMEDSLTRLEGGESFPYVLGHWEFFGLDFNVTPDVLIPRPETELLVEKAILWLNNHPEKRRVADVGTGSGAIAISTAINVPDAKILATDISINALQVAKANAENHGVSRRIDFVECDLLPDSSLIENRNFPIDLLCANLPYIPTKTLQRLSIFGREPALALDGGEDGFDIIRRLLNIGPARLGANSLMLLEIEATLGEQAVSLAQQMLPYANIRLHQDLSGRDRLVEIELP
jgi:release factor glutamine methyltransferase